MVQVPILRVASEKLYFVRYKTPTFSVSFREFNTSSRSKELISFLFREPLSKSFVTPDLSDLHSPHICSCTADSLKNKPSFIQIQLRYHSIQPFKVTVLCVVRRHATTITVTAAYFHFLHPKAPRSRGLSPPLPRQLFFPSQGLYPCFLRVQDISHTSL